MKHLYLPLILFLFVVFEGVALDLLPVQLLNTQMLLVPHWVLVVLIFIAILYDTEDTNYSIVYGIIFGLLIDIVYTGILGVYMFSYGFVIYMMYELRKLVHTNFYAISVIGIIGISLADLFIHAIYAVLGFADMVWSEYFILRLLPTALANLVFLMMFYPLFRRAFTNWHKE